MTITLTILADADDLDPEHARGLRPGPEWVTDQVSALARSGSRFPLPVA
jgi:hypothetical protein